MSRVALVLGGSKGIGLACAEALAAGGDTVAVTWRTSPPPDEYEGLAIRCDLTDPEQLDAAFAEVEATLGPVEKLIVSAGVTRDGLLMRMSDEDFESVLDTNLVAAFRALRRAARPMIKSRWGRVVFIGSVSGIVGQAGQVNYAASKAGLMGMAKSAARELATRNITVNVVAPGPVDTDMTSKLSDGQRSGLLSMVPMERMGTTGEIAAAVAFLASEDASYVTGVVLAVDGGLAMG